MKYHLNELLYFSTALAIQNCFKIKFYLCNTFGFLDVIWTSDVVLFNMLVLYPLIIIMFLDKCNKINIYFKHTDIIIWIIPQKKFL